MLKFTELKIPDKLWQLIAKAEGSESKMRFLLTNMSKEELIRFGYYFNCAVMDLFTQVQVSRYLPTSNDTAELISGWVTSQGKEYFENVFDNPEQFPVIHEDEIGDNFYGLAGVVYEERFQTAIPDPVDTDWW
jgi:hypothetical protein